MSSRSRNSDNFESVSSRRNVFVAMFIVVTICGTIYIVLSRLSNDAVGLVIGICLGGLLTGIPLALAIYGYLRYLSNKSERRESYNPQPYIIQIPSQSPPQPALPDYVNWTVNGQNRKVRREWDCLGDSDNEQLNYNQP